MSKRLIAFIALVGIAVGVTACDNTIRGAGADIRQTGDAIQDAAS